MLAPQRAKNQSQKLTLLTNTPTGLPTLSDVLDPAFFPFVESAKLAKPMNWGVVKLKNIPFATTRAEVVGLFGRKSKLLNDDDEGVHIIMDKATSKTMDAYVEFITLTDAMRAVDRHRARAAKGRQARLGDRFVEIEMSCQGQLMHDIFSYARGIVWTTPVPQILPYDSDQPWNKFKGFISEEEMIMLVKHVEVPHRSPYSRNCPQRPYECFISIVRKLPWFESDMITVKQRDAVYNTAVSLIRQLTRSMLLGESPEHLTPLLLRRLVLVAITCPGFTPLQKDNFAWMTCMQSLDFEYFQLPPFASCWRHQYAIGPKPGYPFDLLQWYVAIIREQSGRDVLARPSRERVHIQSQSDLTDMYWGYFWAEVEGPGGALFDEMTLGQVAVLEFAAIERILYRALQQQQ
ncbi:hypothetical protein ACQKWADRAFT_281277 [Trichoderma austrokoningii]